MVSIGEFYESLKGMTFNGSYIGDWPEHGKTWQMFDIQDGEPVITTLQSIRALVGEGHVWRGFTGPEDSYCGLPWSYRFFAKFEGSNNVSGKYQILDVQSFPIPPNSGYTNNCGYAISIKDIQLQPDPVTPPTCM